MELSSKVYLRSHCDERMLEGHLWAFSNEVERTEGSIVPGGLVDLYSHRKKFLGRGFYNPHSLIAFRLLSSNASNIDASFFAQRFETARDLRALALSGEDSYRLVFGESDFLPGLVIDRFGDRFVIQSYCLGMDLLLPPIVEALKKIFKPSAIVLKNDSSIRAMESLPSEVKVLEGQSEEAFTIEQTLDGRKLKFLVDPIHGQKSGFFFDQRKNRARLADFSKGKDVLDAYSYSGGFGVYAAAGGAKKVTSIDSSADAVALTQKNFQANQVTGEALQEDVEEALKRFQGEKRKFDIIVLDPPALAKTRKNIFGAIRKYENLNAAAMGLLKSGGVLFSCSCSHHVTRADFMKMLGRAALSAGRKAKVLEMRGASVDHPIHPSMPETEYLKCAVLSIE